MQDQKIITRSSLYDSQSEYESDSSEYVAPKIDLEFIEIKSNSDGVGNEEENVIESMEEDKDDEFEFPLFASAMEVDPSSSDKIEDRGRSKEVGIMKVSLREQSEERIDNERPNSYYFAKYSEQEKKQFEQCSVTGDDIYKQFYIVDAQPWKCLDLNKHNAKVELELSRDKERKKKNRPGKKKREMKVACRQRKLERAKLKKLEEEEKKRQLKKQKYQRKSFGRNNSLNKKFNKSGGANKKPQQKQHAKPKYRTE